MNRTPKLAKLPVPGCVLYKIFCHQEQVKQRSETRAPVTFDEFRNLNHFQESDSAYLVCKI
jgi:hypothetical protein